MTLYPTCSNSFIINIIGGISQCWSLKYWITLSECKHLYLICSFIHHLTLTVFYSCMYIKVCIYMASLPSWCRQRFIFNLIFKFLFSSLWAFSLPVWCGCAEKLQSNLPHVRVDHISQSFPSNALGPLRTGNDNSQLWMSCRFKSLLTN